MMLQVNGGAFSTPYVNGYNTGNGSGTPTTCGSQFLSLSANDYVEVYTDGAFTPYGTHLGWGGTLLG